MQEKERFISHIKQRILLFISTKGVSKYKFYKETGISRGVLDKPSGLSEDNTARFIAYFPDVNLEWLIMGTGEMLKTKNTKDLINKNDEKNDEFFDDKPNVQKRSSMQSNDLIELTSVSEMESRNIQRLMGIIEEQAAALRQMSRIITDSQDDRMNELRERRKQIEKNGK